MSRGFVDGSTHGPERGDGRRPLTLAGVKVTHKRASIDQLEVASHEDPRERLDELLAREGVSEAAVLQTCNRVEEYVVAGSANQGRTALSDFSAILSDAMVDEMGHAESLRHLLRVAAGLESQVMGEDQILGQVRQTYAASKNAGALGPVLEDAFLKAIHVGERARSETAINEGVVSLGSAAVDLVVRERGLDGRILVVGAGDVARTVVMALHEQGADGLCVTNRSADRAAALAFENDAEWTDFEELTALLANAEVVIASTGSASPVIDHDSLADAGETLVVDLGQPRDVVPDVREIVDVDLLDLDDLRSVTRSTHEERREAARSVEGIVEDEYERLIEAYKRKRADAVVSGMYRGAEEIKERELERAFVKLDGLDAGQREVVEAMADAIVSRLLAVPTESLRDAAANDDLETLLAAIELFDPGVDPDEQRQLISGVAEALVQTRPPESTPASEGSED